MFFSEGTNWKNLVSCHNSKEMKLCYIVFIVTGNKLICIYCECNLFAEKYHVYRLYVRCIYARVSLWTLVPRDVAASEPWERIQGLPSSHGNIASFTQQEQQGTGTYTPSLWLRPWYQYLTSRRYLMLLTEFSVWKGLCRCSNNCHWRHGV